MPKSPIGGVIQNLVLMQRTGTALAAEVTEPFIQELFDELAALIAKLDPTEASQDARRRARVERLLGDVTPLVGRSFEEIRKELRSRLAQVGASQGRWTVDHLRRRVLGSAAVEIGTGRVGVNMMKAILDRDPFQGETLKGWADAAGVATVQRVRRQIQLGMAQGESLDDLIRRIRGRRANGRFVGGVMETTTREAEALARTAVNFITNRAHVETYAANADVLKALEVTATLDTRTTEICMALDGQTTSAAEPDPKMIPPFHWRCRTVLVPVVDWEGLGIIPPPDGQRASMTGPVDSRMTYEDWLRQQSHEIQDEVLGKGRAQLFRTGKVSLTDFIRQDRTLVPLDDLLGKFGPPPVPVVPPRPPFPSAGEVGARLEATSTEWGPEYVRLRKQLLEAGNAVQFANDHGTSNDWFLASKRERMAKQELERFEERRMNAMRAVVERTPEDRSELVLIAESGKHPKMQEGGDQFRRLVSRRWDFGGQPVKVKGEDYGRAHAWRELGPQGAVLPEISMHVATQPKSWVHELGHALEFAHGDVMRAAIAFRERRTVGETPQWLGGWFGLNEVAKPDKFRNAYVGKVYRKPDGTIDPISGIDELATEVVSMGLEYMATDPLAFWREDPDHFRFIWELMNGVVPTP